MYTDLIECVNLCRSFDVGGQPFHALREVNLRIGKGSLVAIIGASGSGKSTLLNAIGALDAPSSGQLLFEGKDLAQMTEPDLAALRNARMGFVFQQFNLLPRYEAWRNVELPMIYSGKGTAERKSRAIALLSQLGLAEHAFKRPTQMSGGQQQRVAIARALANQPELILADEPTGALDSRTSEEVMQLLIDLNRKQGITVAIVTHDPSIAARCDRVIKFADGRVVEDSLVRGTAS